MKPAVANVFFDDLNACPHPQLLDVDFPWQMVKLNNDFPVSFPFEDKGSVHETAALKGNVVIREGVVVEAYAVIEGPVILGENTLVRPHAWLRPGTITGKDCVIGKGSEIKNAIVFDESKIGTNCFVGDSVLGKGARVGSGVIFANRRFDQEIVHVTYGNERHSTGTDKFCAVVGEFSRLGANVVLSPGTLIGKHAWVAASHVSGFVPPNKLLKAVSSAELLDKPRVPLKQTDEGGKR